MIHCTYSEAACKQASFRKLKSSFERFNFVLSPKLYFTCNYNFIDCKLDFVVVGSDACYQIYPPQRS